MKKRSVPAKQPVKTSSAPRTSNKQQTKPGKSSSIPSDKPTETNDDFAKPEASADDLSTKPMEDLSLSDAPAQQSQSSAGSGTGPLFWTWQDKKNIRMNSDIYGNSINGCCFMANGDLVICDNNNQLIKSFHHKTGSNMGNLFLPACPYGIAALDDTTAIVTLPGQKILQLIKVLPSLQKGSVISIEKECRGIDVSGDKIYVSCSTVGKEDGEICIFGLFGSLIKSFPIYNVGSCVLKSPMHICVNKSGSKLFVTDSETDTVLCLTTDGKLIYEYRHPELKSPRGLCVYKNDDVFVCGYDSKNVQLIAADGKTEMTFLMTMYLNPLSIAYRVSNGQVAIGSKDSEDMLYLNASRWSM